MSTGEQQYRVFGRTDFFPRESELNYYILVIPPEGSGTVQFLSMPSKDVAEEVIDRLNGYRYHAYMYESY